VRLPIRFSVLIVSLAVAGSATVTAYAGATTFKLTLIGSNAVPRGDKGDKATAIITLDPKKSTACWVFSGLKGVSSPSRAHIGNASARKRGPTIVSLGKTYKPSGCVKAATTTIAAILKRPSRYYLTIDNRLHPNGAVRAQL
jgi:CHRD domain